MIFVDTSAIYAWADAADPNHRTAVRRLQAVLDRGDDLLTHNYVLLESTALIQARLGLPAAVGLAQDAESFVVAWVDEELHGQAVRELGRMKKRQISLVDHVSFLVMKKRGVGVAFAFDPDFVAAGFSLLDA